jgi:uncharacterized membrane protein
MVEWLPTALKLTTRIIEVGGISIIVLGVIGATGFALWQVVERRPGDDIFGLYRSNLGRVILLGLEFLVAADIINTVAIEPTLESLLILAGIVLIRTFLSFSLEVEIEGRWPWERVKAAANGVSSSGQEQPAVDDKK